MSIGTQSAPRIGLEKGPFERAFLRCFFVRLGRFSVPAGIRSSDVRSGGQHWPKATTPVARSGVEGREHGAIVEEVGLLRRGLLQARFLNRQLSLPVSTISQWWVRLSRSAVVILASPKTLGHSAKSRLVVTMMDVRS